jgi:hypothetical protein
MPIHDPDTPTFWIKPDRRRLADRRAMGIGGRRATDMPGARGLDPSTAVFSDVARGVSSDVPRDRGPERPALQHRENGSSRSDRTYRPPSQDGNGCC